MINPPQLATENLKTFLQKEYPYLYDILAKVEEYSTKSGGYGYAEITIIIEIRKGKVFLSNFIETEKKKYYTDEEKDWIKEREMQRSR